MLFRLVSDYEVTLVNDSMQEFYVWFYGPSESAQSPTHFLYVPISMNCAGPICTPRYAVALTRWLVQERLCLFGRHQPNMVTNVW